MSDPTDTQAAEAAPTDAPDDPRPEGGPLPEGEQQIETGDPAAMAAAERENVRIAEALLFASTAPLTEASLAERLPRGADVRALLVRLKADYEPRGVNLVEVAGGWAFRTAGDLSFLLSRDALEQKRLSRAALETLAIIAYHQPSTRAEIEEIRGVSTSKGTLDVLLETGWVRMRGRRRSPGRPVTYGTTPAFLDHFGFAVASDLPGLEELRGAGLLSSELPADFKMPVPRDSPDLFDDEDPLEDGEEDLLDDDGSDEEGPDAEEALDRARDMRDEG